MPADLHDPKNLTEWLELDAHERPRPFRQRRRQFFWAVFVLGIAAVVAWSFWRGPALYQAGPLSVSHALFQQECTVCHQQAFATAARLLPGHAAHTSVPDSACLQCHNGARHQPAAVLAAEPHCAACHHEHRGPQELARVADGHCLSCHKDLGQASVAGHQPRFASFGGWDSHPPFLARWAGHPRDPGTLTFPHDVHLKEGGVEMPAAGQQEDREGERPPTVKKALGCADCHQSDEAGRFMQPVRYEQHCQECHPLSVRLDVAPAGEAARAAARRFAETPAPHREPVVVRGVLRERLLDLIWRPAGLNLRKADTEEPPLSALPFGWPQGRPASRTELDWANGQLHGLEQRLFYNKGGCGYCHRMTALEETPGSGLPVFAPTRVNRRPFEDRDAESVQWFPHARFRHDAHRMLRCEECHDARNSHDSAEVLLPGIDTCRKCHGGNRAGSARSGCVECHTYHPPTDQRRFQGRRTGAGGR